MLQIEKVVKLLDDFHFRRFREYVKNISLRSYYPLALLDVLDRDADREQDSAVLYRQVYGDAPEGEKDMKKFFQLAHYTFKLTRYLAYNYPSYLQANFPRIEELINRGEADRAFHLAEMLLDIAEKVEDHLTEARLLHLFVQREVLQESAHRTLDYHRRLAGVLAEQQGLNEVFERLHTHFGAKGKPQEGADLEPHLAFFRGQAAAAKAFTRQAVSRFCTLFALYYFKHPDFYKAETSAELEALERDLEKNDYVIFPFLFTIHHRVALLQLHHRLGELGPEHALEAADHLLEGSRDVLYWNSFVNLPEIFSIAVKTSHFLNHHFTSYRRDHPDVQPAEVRAQLDELKEHCRRLLDNPRLEQQYTLRYINVSYMYAGLLLLGPPADIRESARLLNALLLTYQQVPFHQVIDPIYTVLIMAHFSREEYEEVSHVFNRYRKATKGKAVNPENDLAVNGFYYLGRWRETGRDQYVRKFWGTVGVEEQRSLSSTQRLLRQVADYFQMPNL